MRRIRWIARSTHVFVPSIVAVGLASLGCSSAPPSSAETKPSVDDLAPEQPGASEGDGDKPFMHNADLGARGARDPFDILRQRQEEGPPHVRARLHSCQKVQIAALRSLLSGLGVSLDPAPGAPLSAAELFLNGGVALGRADYDSRVGEALVWTTAGAVRLFDIFVQAAPEIISHLSSAPLCQIGGVGPSMFDAQGRCVREGVTCLLGIPATDAHVEACDAIVEGASDPGRGEVIAVAALLSAAYSCE